MLILIVLNSKLTFCIYHTELFYGDLYPLTNRSISNLFTNLGVGTKYFIIL